MNRYLLALVAATIGLAQDRGIDLSGQWRRSADDRPEYARSAFDDHDWAVTRLPWTQFPGFGNYWVRRSIELPVEYQGRDLFLTLGPIGEAYQVYVNEALVGAAGRFGASDSELTMARTRTFPTHAASRRLSIAIRIEQRLLPQSFILYAGGSYSVTRDEPDVAAENLRLLVQQRLKFSPNLAINSVLVAFGLLFWLLWLTERGKTELVWLATLAATRGIGQLAFYFAISFDTVRVPLLGDWFHDINGIALAELVLGFANLRNRWLHCVFWGAWSLQLMLSLPVRFTALIDGGALVLVFLGWKNDRRYGWPSWLLLALATLSHLNVGLRLVRSSVEIRGYDFNLTSLAIGGLSALLVVLSLRRLAEDRREKQRLAGELEAARTVQQLLLPASTMAGPSFAVDAIYAPALEVGGDFHWNSVTPSGSVVVVIGDVSGKGLKAAMLVSVAVGALRNERSRDPREILAALNRALTGHTGGGFVTACCALCQPDGGVSLANAGHPPPWLDGQEVFVEPGLPLGVSHDSCYETATINMPPGAVLTLVSDGVVEAENAQRELFGFDRTREISTQSAQEIATAAKAWGQNDDITVVTVRRNG